MWFAVFALFLTVLGAGWLTRLVPTARTTWMKPLLAFSGAYLFTLTVTHLLPEALQMQPGHRVGYFVLAGFFGQMLLEVFSQGVEHGHVHHHTEHAGRVPFLLLSSLVLHSFLEGSILVKTPAAGDVSQNFYAILAGVALHHIPAAFALMAALLLRLGSFRRALPYLLVFAVAGPAGIIVSNFVVLEQLLTGGLYAALLGLVAGNFLHVSTTILFETSPDHSLNVRKLVATLAGLLLALLVDVG
ncbi:ZIP family metal transporter [Hymenobacter sp. 5516J-16]|uniref:ZIP family metal transporter n=1 Tax=Hymenobacter sublimis TaxID=2933777 RepID=A0ABY4J834_9BACT|nr:MULTISPECIES: ZIP family metal transporter [Hymenobacter]UOQ79017.1 ZIP family metal transporter [Hymenobacter sp. 5516J-16]UPL48965.1 ZIP family metal transporter [Hymenobacter sublimis]